MWLVVTQEKQIVLKQVAQGAAQAVQVDADSGYEVEEQTQLPW